MWPVIHQHAEDAALLYHARTSRVAAPHVTPFELHRSDERLEAHLDGLSVAGEHGWVACDAALDVPSAGAIFVATVHALRSGNEQRFDRILELPDAAREHASAVVAALNWVEPGDLQAIVARRLRSDDAFVRGLGLAACGAHRVDPGAVLARSIADPDPSLRSHALRASAELGRRELVSACAAAAQDDDPDCRSWAAWSAVLLGDRRAALAELTRLSLTPQYAHRARAFPLALQGCSLREAHAAVQEMAADPQQRWWVIRGSGIAGDPAYVPWLIRHMRELRTARVAAEAFMTITGLDLFQGFEVPPPEGVEAGPSDNPEDGDVDVDPDEGLPWPDVQRVERWWDANRHRFQPGQRYFIGAPVTRGHCIDVLKHGYQRQRILAARYLCLLDPGTPLFDTSAPAWRQQRLLAQMR